MDKVKYFKIRKRYLPTAWPTYNYWKGMEVITGIKSSILHLWEKNGIYTGIVEVQSLKKRGEWAYNYIIEKYKNNLDILREKGYLSGEKLIEECSNFSLQNKNFTLKDFSDFYKKVDSLYIDYYANNMLFWLSADQVVVDKINGLLNSYSESDKKEIFNGMKLPIKLSYSNIQESEFNTLVDFAISDGFESMVFKNKVTNFSNKYIWFPFEYGGPEIYDVETVIKRVQEHIKKGDKIEKYFEEEIINHQNDLIKKYNLNDEVVFHFKIIQTLALMQDDRKAVNARACYFVNNIVLSKLSKIIGLPTKDLFLIDPWLLDEYIDVEDLSGLREKIEKRNEMFLICLDENDKIEFKEGESECTSFLNDLDITINEKVINNNIIGKVAYPGKVTGIARVVTKSSECDRLKDGQILVTYMTTPDFVPFLKRASAIVTEEGSITCHAAIVARELKKPCITGTGNVMSIVKDGDMVEVDANNGIVRIIK